MTQPSYEPPDVSPAPGATPRLNAALAIVQAAIGRAEVKRDRTVMVTPKDASKDPYSYSYATLASISNLALPLLGDNGLAFTCWPGASSDGKGLSLRYSLRHESGETLDGEWPIGGTDNIQALGGRLTYLRRYALAAILGIAAEEDDDAMGAMLADDQSDGPASVRAPSRARTAPARSNQARRQAAPAAADALPGGPVTAVPQPMMNLMFGVLNKWRGDQSREDRLALVSDLTGRPIATSKDLTKDEVQAIIDTAQSNIGNVPPTDGTPPEGNEE